MPQKKNPYHPSLHLNERRLFFLLLPLVSGFVVVHVERAALVGRRGHGRRRRTITTITFDDRVQKRHVRVHG